jgi:hypothetical protein
MVSPVTPASPTRPSCCNARLYNQESLEYRGRSRSILRPLVLGLGAAGACQHPQTMEPVGLSHPPPSTVICFMIRDSQAVDMTLPHAARRRTGTNLTLLRTWPSSFTILGNDLNGDSSQSAPAPNSPCSCCASCSFTITLTSPVLEAPCAVH